MTTRTRSHELDTEGKIEVERVLIKRGWTVERIRSDYGEDLFVRVFVRKKATRFSFFIQVKGTDSPEKLFLRRRDGFSFSIKSSHLEHWLSFIEPVFLVLFDAKGGSLYWTCIHELPFRIGLSRTKSTSVFIAREDVLDDEGVERIYAKTKRHVNRLLNERAGVTALLDTLKEQYGLIVHHNAELEVIEFPAGKFVADDEDKNLNFVMFGELGRLIRRSRVEPIDLVRKGYDVMKYLEQQAVVNGDPTLVERFSAASERRLEIELSRLADDEQQPSDNQVT